MTAVTTHSGEKTAAGPPEPTGWARARRTRGEGVRTCVPAVLDRRPVRPPGDGSEDTIVRGED